MVTEQGTLQSGCVPESTTARVSCTDLHDAQGFWCVDVSQEQVLAPQWGDAMQKGLGKL